MLPLSMTILPTFLTGLRDLSGTLAVIAGAGRWTLTSAQTGVTVTGGDAGATSTLRLDPCDLALLVWGRISVDEAVSRGATIEGDAALPAAVLETLDPL